MKRLIEKTVSADLSLLPVGRLANQASPLS